MTITHDHFPMQLPIIASGAVVALDGDLTRLLPGDIVRADAEEPNVTIIMLEDGRFVLGSECSFTPITEVAATMTPDKVEPTRVALEAQIKAQIEETDDCSRAEATELAKSILGDDWLFQNHAAHGSKPQVFVGRYVGEYAEPVPAG